MLVHTAQNLFYLTGHYTFGVSNYQCLLLPADPAAHPQLVVRQLESGNARVLSWLPDDGIVPFDDTDDPVALTARLVSSAVSGGARVGLEESSFYLSSRAAASFREALPDVEVVDAGGLVEGLRRVKSPAEIDQVRHACELTALGMRAAIGEIAAGRTENDVAASAFDAMIRAGSEFLTIDPIVTSGPRSGIPHMTFHRRVLEPGDTVLLEMGAAYRRYIGPSMRSAVIGPPSDDVRRYADLCLEGLDRAISAVRPGVTSGDVDAACRGVFERAGLWEHFRKRTGYAVGIGFAPGWVEDGVMSLKADDPTVLEPGMVFHVPPAMRMHGIFGVGFSETLAVTEDGCEIMPSAARKLVTC
jgi:Xaa-Pro dipeptidase